MNDKIINNIKSLAMDMITEAGSGHPGITLGAAPILYTLYMNHLNINPNDPNWKNRDRFVLSAGHGSALLYSTLFMSGYDLTINDLKNFRKIDSKTPGHPEYRITPGVDVSTGPLGQGIASAVGMAIGEKLLEKRYLYNDKPLINYNVYVLCGDGDLMEGISYEACSLAGTLKLDNLIVLYDSNMVSLDGNTNMAFRENIIGRFASMGWETYKVKNGNNVFEIDKCIKKAKKAKKPVLIEVKTIIGDGSLLAGTSEIHGKMLTIEDYTQLKTKLNMSMESFSFDNDIRMNMINNIEKRTNKRLGDWKKVYEEYTNSILNKDSYGKYDLPDNKFNIDLHHYEWKLDSNMVEATRISNGKIMSVISNNLDSFVGGSADLSSSTKTYLKGLGDFGIENYKGRNIWFGVREHAMGAILNGLALTDFRPYGSTFLAFSDYIKPAIRMSALMRLPVTYIFSHDSVNVGQDGPTHEPIEQLAMLRSIPGFTVYRPADFHELVGCWDMIIRETRPCALILSRSDVPLLNTTDSLQVLKGAYVVRKEKNFCDAVIIATGSEVSTAITVSDELYTIYGKDIRVVSMPSMEVFLKQPVNIIRDTIPNTKIFVLEAGSSFGWQQFVINNAYLININSFGFSGSSGDVMTKLHFDKESIKNKIMSLLK